MMVGARVRDAGRLPSTAQATCLDLVQKMGKLRCSGCIELTRTAMKTLIRPVSRAGVEDVKALSELRYPLSQLTSPVLLAAFNDNGWLMAGHAVRLAMDLGLNRAFNELLQTGMGAGKTGTELERERALVEKARVWFCVSRPPCPLLTLPVVSPGASDVLRVRKTGHCARRRYNSSRALAAGPSPGFGLGRAPYLCRGAAVYPRYVCRNYPTGLLADLVQRPCTLSLQRHRNCHSTRQRLRAFAGQTSSSTPGKTIGIRFSSPAGRTRVSSESRVSWLRTT